MTVHIRGYCERAAAQPEPGTPIRFVASTEGVARDGMVIAADGWDLANYEANPVILWAHDYGGRTLPIGRAEKVWVDGRKLMADVVFDQNDPFAVQVEQKYRNGFLSAVSVGWDTKEMQPAKGMDGAPKVTRAELLDISAVPVPGDPKALKERQARALADLGRDLITMTDTDDAPDPDELDWQGTALQMARLFAPAAREVPVSERRRLYDRLEARYRRAGRTAPEFLPSEHLDALDGETRRRLFFHGEPEFCPELFADGERAGAVLSARNKADLERAAELISGVIQRAAKEAEQAQPDGTDTQRDAEGSNAVLAAIHRKLTEKG